jgi:putative ABC transport system substrate-binding protein
MQASGYSDGKDFRLVEAYADNNADRLAELAKQLVVAKVDVTFVSTTNVAAAAQKATDQVPIVFYSVSDPVRAGFADSIAHPGQNLTGLTNVSGDLNGKRLQLLKQMVPRLEHVFVLGNPSNPYISSTLERLRPAAAQLGLANSLVLARGDAELESAFVGMHESVPAAVLVTADVEFYLLISDIARLATGQRLPSIFPFSAAVSAGGLMSYGVDEHDDARHVVTYIDRIFKGAKPGDLPIEQPTKLDLLVNRKTADLLGLAIPNSITVQAARIVS